MQPTPTSITEEVKNVLLGIWERNKKPVIDALKEAIRLSILAAIPFAVERVTGMELPLELKAGVIVALRLLDKFLHVKGKVENNDLLTKGIARI